MKLIIICFSHRQKILPSPHCHIGTPHRLVNSLMFRFFPSKLQYTQSMQTLGSKKKFITLHHFPSFYGNRCQLRKYSAHMTNTKLKLSNVYVYGLSFSVDLINLLPIYRVYNQKTKKHPVPRLPKTGICIITMA